MATNLTDFLELMREQFAEEQSKVTADQDFRDLEEWSSMQALIIITAIDEAYGRTLDEAELRKAKTFEDLFTLVKSS